MGVHRKLLASLAAGFPRHEHKAVWVVGTSRAPPAALRRRPGHQQLVVGGCERFCCIPRCRRRAAARAPLGSRPLRSTSPLWPSRPGGQRSRTPKQRPPHRLLRCPPQRRPRAPRRQRSRRRSQWPAFLRPLAKRPSRRPMGARPARQPGTRRLRGTRWCGPQRLRAPRHHLSRRKKWPSRPRRPKRRPRVPRNRPSRRHSG